MEEFDPMRMYTYTATQLADIIAAGQISLEELYHLGYPAAKRPELEAELEHRREEIEKERRKPIEDDQMWSWACSQNTLSAYKSYLSTYDVYGEGQYQGKHIFDARQRVEELKREAETLKEELFESMKTQPWLFNPQIIQYLVNGVSDTAIIEGFRYKEDVVSRFICTGQRISFNEIKQLGVIGPNMTLELLMAPNYELIQTNIRELGDFPLDNRTDVFFLGVPRGGKSSVLAGIFAEMFNNGLAMYEPQFNSEGRDLCEPYYRALIKSVSTGKFPVSTGHDTVSFMKMQLSVGKRNNPLTFVELGGEAFVSMADAHRVGADIWESLDAGQCLRSKNRKLLAFIVDYSIHRGDVRNDGIYYDDAVQSEVLDKALNVFGTDGPNRRKPEEGCTLSKVDTIAIIVTKSDLMPGNSSVEKMEAAKEYVLKKFGGFLHRLRVESKSFGINKPNGYDPYLLTFSLGDLMIGNTYRYNNTDSANIVRFISDVSRSTSNGGGFWNAFKGR